jgi:hypothetical protein
MSIQDPLPQKWFPVIAFLVVLPPWIWMAVNTKQCLQVISMRTIPYPKRTIWLIKMLALILAAGGVFEAATELGMPWLIAMLPSGIVVYFAVREHVEDINPPKPNQDTSFYLPSWQQYRDQRRAFMRSCIWSGAAFLTLVMTVALAGKLPNAVQIILFTVCVVALIATGAVASVKHLKLIRWACPRCGCAFRGFWGVPWMPKNCAYCGLPREDDSKALRARS